MTEEKPNISVNVDVTNPGQFFACCGLLELAGRLWPGAEGWFDVVEGQFNMTCCGTLSELLDSISQIQIESSLGKNERKRLATLLSAAKTNLTEADQEEKQRLQAAWRVERLYVTAPFRLWLDWWRDEEGNRTKLKTWAAKQMVSEMASAMALAIHRHPAEEREPNGPLFRFTHDNSLPFNFDSDLCRTGNARDAGFSADTLGLKVEYRPLLELLAFIGLQRFRPRSGETQTHFTYYAWRVRLPLTVAGPAASGSISLPGGVHYRFELFSRTKYMKAFLPAQPLPRSLVNV